METEVSPAREMDRSALTWGLLLAGACVLLASLTGCSVTYWVGTVKATRKASDGQYERCCEQRKPSAPACPSLYAARKKAQEDADTFSSTIGTAGSKREGRALLKADRTALNAASAKVKADGCE